MSRIGRFVTKCTRVFRESENSFFECIVHWFLLIVSVCWKILDWKRRNLLSSYKFNTSFFVRASECERIRISAMACTYKRYFPKFIRWYLKIILKIASRTSSWNWERTVSMREKLKIQIIWNFDFKHNREWKIRFSSRVPQSVICWSGCCAIVVP